MVVDEKAFAIHSMHKVAVGDEGNRRGSTRHPSLKSHWHSWGGRGGGRLNMYVSGGRHECIRMSGIKLR